LDGPDALADVEALARFECAREIHLGLGDGLGEAPALRPQGRDCGRQRTAGAVRIRHRHAPAGKAQRAACLDEPVRAVRAAQMAALHEHRLRAERAQCLALLDHRGFVGSRRDAQQRRGLGQVRRDDARKRQQFFAQRRNGFGREQRMVALRDHHSVEHDALRPMAAQRLGDGAHDIRVGEHADLHGIDADIVENGVELCRDERRIGRVDGRDAARVLRGECGDDARAVGAERRERLEVGLDARAAARIGAGDREDVGNR
jgi:hypothetical protein